ncbi:MAG: GGDEF domain-containing protein [Burkholderiales bacterium]|nr:GGDEF domain-containing protein [Burkholderiales bacterium]
MSLPEFSPTEQEQGRDRHWLLDGVLGRDRAVHVRVRHQMTALGVYVGAAIALATAIAQGIAPPGLGWSLFAWIVIGQAIFLALMRSGWSMRLRDPGMMLPQSVFALTTISVAYALLWPIRASALILAVQVVVFGMFSLTPRQTIGVGAFAVAILGASMAWMAHHDPIHYPPTEEWLHFLTAVITLSCASTFVHYAARLRERLTRQKQELRAALAQAQLLATTDALTGLHNRLHMQDLLKHECIRQDRHGGAFTVVLLDLDFFKHINDQHGHQVGDAILQGFGKVLSEALRSTDAVARWGGEEFLVLLPATKLEVAQLTLRRLREHLMSSSLSAQHASLRVNFSSGLAEHRTEESLEATLERADRGLYRAKEAGRGRDWVGH